MTPLLVSLLDAARNDPAALAALADHLTEVSPADRVELLAGLLAHWASLEQCRRDFAYHMEQNPHRQEFRQELRIPGASERQLSAMRHEDLARARLSRSLFESLANAIEHDRWYAIRLHIRTREESFPNPSAIVRGSLDVVPLDGGTINTQT